MVEEKTEKNNTGGVIPTAGVRIVASKMKTPEESRIEMIHTIIRHNDDVIRKLFIHKAIMFTSVDKVPKGCVKCQLLKSSVEFAGGNDIENVVHSCTANITEVNATSRRSCDLARDELNNILSVQMEKLSMDQQAIYSR